MEGRGYEEVIPEGGGYDKVGGPHSYVKVMDLSKSDRSSSPPKKSKPAPPPKPVKKPQPVERPKPKPHTRTSVSHSDSGGSSVFKEENMSEENLEPTKENIDPSGEVVEKNEAMEKLLNALAKHDSDAALCSVAQTILTSFPLIPNISKSIAGSAIAPSKWLLQYFPRVSDAVVPELISALRNLSFYCSISPKASKIFEKKLRILCRDDKQVTRIREACLTSSSADLNSAAINAIVKMASIVEAPATEKIVNYLMELLAAARFPEQRVIILEGLAKCAETDKDDCIFEKIASNLITKFAAPDKEGTLDIQLLRLASLTSTSYPALILKTMTILLFWPNWQVRKCARLSVERILRVEKTHFAEALASEIFTETINGYVDQTYRKLKHNQLDSSATVLGEWYVQVLRLLLFTEGTELDELAIHTLWMHSQADSNRWEASALFQERVVNLVLCCTDRNVRCVIFFPFSICLEKLCKACLSDNALLTLVALNVPSIRCALWDHIEKSVSELNVDDYVRIPERHVSIYRCTEGHLYNTDVLEFHNMRRENKAYSFRDQLAELQLRRELAEKKRREGKLTTLQKQEIRDEIGRMYENIEVKLDELRAMVAADHHGALARYCSKFSFCEGLKQFSASLLIRR
uniref:TOG domain-containing protein n=1 Tax=Angiostrongylus cantonensis TaxID=6313 RepID=A0A158PBY9_ANGCA